VDTFGAAVRRIREFLGFWSGFLGDEAREFFGMWKRDEGESTLRYVVTRSLLTLFAPVLFVLFVGAGALFLVLAAMWVVIAVGFLAIVAQAIVRGGPVSHDIPDSASLLGMILLGLAVFADWGGENFGYRLWLGMLGAGMTVTAPLL
jgi:hypothetical protein